MSLAPDLEALHKASIRHREIVLSSPLCGCFHCLQTFPPSAITEWVDDGTTALCPRCSIDAVLPGVAVELASELLEAMQARWFGAHPKDRGARFLAKVAEIDAAYEGREFPSVLAVPGLVAPAAESTEHMTVERLVAALGASVEAFEAACREASPLMLENALVILTQSDPAASPVWVVERKWGAALLERILDGRWSV